MAALRLLLGSVPAAGAVSACAARLGLNPSVEDRAVLEDRRRREELVQEYVRGGGLALYRAECHGREASRRCVAARAAIEARTQELMHPPGVTAHSLRHYHLRHGCTRCTRQAVEAAAAASRGRPVVEVGAGRGHWAKALSDAGLEVSAFDDGSAVPGGGADPLFPVRRGGGSEALRDSRATLLLVFPPPTPMAREALDAFAGSLVLYAGEPRGGANADDGFFDKLEAHYFVRDVVALDPFPGGVERLYVLEKRPWWWRRGVIRRKTSPV